MADEIRADYQQLQQVATKFSKQAASINQMRSQVKRSMNALQGTWMGKGSESFFSEMQDKVTPGMERLYRALQEAGKITKQMAQIMQQAENDAAAPFKTDVS
jgi:WXG100 family type VII secretion target